jgi:hypothetical protein
MYILVPGCAHKSSGHIRSSRSPLCSLQHEPSTMLWLATRYSYVGSYASRPCFPLYQLGSTCVA